MVGGHSDHGIFLIFVTNKNVKKVRVRHGGAHLRSVSTQEVAAGGGGAAWATKQDAFSRHTQNNRQKLLSKCNPDVRTRNTPRIHYPR